MGKKNNIALLAVAVATIPACGTAAPSDSIGQIVFEGPIAVPRQPPPPLRGHPLPPDRLLAFTDAGLLATIDAGSGAIIATEPLDPEPELDPADLVIDHEAGRAIIVDAHLDDVYAAVGEVPLDADGTLGARVHRAWIDGRARAWPIAAGILLFEQGYGDRWRILRDDGGASASIAGAPPVSAWAWTDGQQVHLDAFGYVELGERILFEHRQTRIDGNAVANGTLSVDAMTLTLGPRSTPPSARVIAGGDWGHALIIDREDGSLTTQALHGALAEAPRRIALSSGVGELVTARPLDDQSRRIAILCAAPAQLWVLDLESDHYDLAMLPLPWQQAAAAPQLTRQLVALGRDRVVVAGPDQLIAVIITRSEAGLTLNFDQYFQAHNLRSPIAGPF